LAALGVSIAALSVDRPAASEALRQQLSLPFPLLCDTGRQVVIAWGLFNEKEKGGIAHPAEFVIDTDRRVRYRVLERTTARVDPQALASFLRSDMQGPTKDAPVKVVPRAGDLWRSTLNVLRRGIKSPRS
jgi:peroxiredoxin